MAALQDSTKNKATDASDILRNVMNTKGAAPKAEPLTYSANVDQIIRQVRRLYKDRINTDIDDKDRIVDGIQWLTTEFPGVSVPLTLLYWMCYGGARLKTQDSDEVIRFGKKVARYKKLMFQRHNRGFIVRAGMVRGYTSREEHTRDELPKAMNRARSAVQYATLVTNAIGNVSTLNMPTDEKSATRALVDAVDNMRRALPLLTEGTKGSK